MEYTTKSGVKPIEVDLYTFSTHDVIDYLENHVLGFKVGHDFTKWDGVTPDHSYVRMRIVIASKDIMADVKPTNYVDRVLSENAAGIMFKEDVINALEPFMYPKTIGNIRNQSETLQHLRDYGVYGERLDELVKNAQLNYSKETGFWCVYLRPERILADMVKNVATNKIEGNMSIIKVEGGDNTSDIIRWTVLVDRRNSFVGSNSIPIDAIFNR